MSSNEPVTVICTYRVQKEQEGKFVELLEDHWPTLKRMGLVTNEPATVYRGEDGPGHPFFVEIFSWKDEEAPRAAHETPEVMAVWEPMGTCVEERNGRPGMEFPHVKPFPLKAHA